MTIEDPGRATLEGSLRTSRDPAIEVFGLTKTFERGRRTMMDRLRRRPDERVSVRALDGVSFSVSAGEVFGLVGPNGAGKTTMMKILCTLLEPSSGTARIFGLDVATDAQKVRARLGAMLTGERSLYWKLTARENLEFFAYLYHVPRREVPARVISALRAVTLFDRADDYVERFSTGMRQRLCIARALLPDPPLVVLDEPTSGLDPRAARDLRDQIVQLRKSGRTVLLATHNMAEADELCDRLAIIDRGRVIALDTPAALKRTIGAKDVIHLNIESAIDPAETIAARFGTTGRRQRADDDVSWLSVRCSVAEEVLPSLLEALRRQGVIVRRIDVEPVSLEDVFLALTGRESSAGRN